MKIDSAMLEDIQNMDLNDNTTFGEIMNMFYDICRKHGIKQCSTSEDGIGMICNNYEYTIASTLLEDRIREYMGSRCAFDPAPDDIRC